MKKFIVVRETPVECETLETAEAYANSLVAGGTHDEVIVAEVVCVYERPELAHRRLPEDSE